MPDPVYLEERPHHRRSLIRRAVLLTPAGIVSTALLAVALMNLPGSAFAVLILGLSSMALDVEAISALRDLRATPVTTEGRVTRLWAKARYLFLGRVHYMLVGRSLFEIGPLAAAELKVEDEVVVTHWPHSHVIINVARKSGPASPPPAQSSPGRYGEAERS